jgi:hypothetical protein
VFQFGDSGNAHLIWSHVHQQWSLGVPPPPPQHEYRRHLAITIPTPRKWSVNATYGTTRTSNSSNDVNNDLKHNNENSIDDHQMVAPSLPINDANDSISHDTDHVYLLAGFREAYLYDCITQLWSRCVDGDLPGLVLSMTSCVYHQPSNVIIGNARLASTMNERFEWIYYQPSLPGSSSSAAPPSNLAGAEIKGSKWRTLDIHSPTGYTSF